MKFFRSVLYWDEKVSNWLMLPDDAVFLRKFSAIIGHTCDSWYWLIGLLLVWIFGECTIRTRAIFLMVGLGFLAVFVLMIKFLIRRRRPEGDWGEIYRVTDPHSFPSGHAARAMAIALFISTFLSPWIVVIFFVWAILVGIARVAMKLHYFSDIVVGWLIGLLSVLLATRIYPWLLTTFQPIFEYLTKKAGC